ncbi:unnamed protein product [Phyllotreta striolata]|uniref:COX assembly mitochondrial protein n=1 Tax=Phyllotreta striolata TaxID=444603 RepID=A0A9N9XVD0_PHYSR|nr:unnamed protein product [Phyllotreta striolata]
MIKGKSERNCVRYSECFGYFIISKRVSRKDLTMHADLSRLHDDKCDYFVDQLKRCHRENPFKKFLGACNGAHDLKAKCQQREHLLRSRRNAEKSAEMQKRMREKSAER